MNDSSNIDISRTWDPSNPHVQKLGIGLLCSFCLLAALFPLSYGSSSYWGAKSARKVVIMLRFFVTLQLGLNFFLLVYIVDNGSPMTTGQFAQYPHSDRSWTYGYGRPLMGIILITSVGLIADAHPAFRQMLILATSCTRTRTRYPCIDDMISNRLASPRNDTFHNHITYFTF